MVEKITSKENPKFRHWLSLLENKGIRKHRQCLISGSKVINELFASHPNEIEALLLPEGLKEDQMLATLAIPIRPGGPKAQLRVFVLSAPLFRQLDLFGTHGPLLINQIPPSTTWDSTEPPKGIEIICALSDPGNLGALTRSAVGFNASSIVLLKEAANPYLPKSLRSSSGATFKIPFLAGPPFAELPNDVIALDSKGQDISKFQWPKSFRLLIGEEGLGLRGQEFKIQLKIPIDTRLESLNATTAAAIALFHYRTQHPL